MSNNGGFGVLPRHLAGRLTLGELGVYVALSWHAGPDGTCYPSHQTIADEIGASVSTVRRSIEGLVQKGLLVVKGRVAADGGQSSNLYLLVVWREQGGWSHRTGGVFTENNERDSLNETQSTTTDGRETRPSDDSHTFALQQQDLLRAAGEAIRVEAKALAAEFDLFWEAYPKKVDKGAARKAWNAAIKKATPATIIAAAKRYADERKDRPRTYTKNPATWLNAESWANEPEPDKPNGGPPDDAWMYRQDFGNPLEGMK